MSDQPSQTLEFDALGPMAAAAPVAPALADNLPRPDQIPTREVTGIPLAMTTYEDLDRWKVS